MEKITAIMIVICCLHNGKVIGLTGGEPANIADFPFIVSVRNYNNCHIMTGTILAANWVLSNAAGHMSLPGGSVSFGAIREILIANVSTVYCDDYNRNIQRKIFNYYINEDAWLANPFTHDLILIRLTTNIPFGDNAQPVQLPAVNTPWPFDQTATMVGWNTTYYATSADEIHLHKSEVTIYSDEYCSNSSLWNGNSIFNPDVMKCGGEVQKNYFCDFDYGGPLLINGTQYGIISYAYIKPGGYCGEFLGIFAPTVTYRDWITEITGL